MDRQVTWLELLGVTMSGAGEPDAGLVWTNLEGWWGLPDARGQGEAIPGDHGHFPRSRILRAARVITLTGHIYTASNRDLHEVRDMLEDALAAGVGTLRVATAAAGVWERNVEIDALKIDPDRGRRWTKFTVDMLAPDPRRYGPLQTVGPVGLSSAEGGVRFPQRAPWNFGRVTDAGRLLVANSGRIPVSPRIAVSGGFSSVVVTDVTARRRLRLDWPLAEGDRVVFDSGTRRVEQGPVEVTRWLTRREWFEVPAGATHEFRFEVAGRAGDPLMAGEYRIGAW